MQFKLSNLKDWSSDLVDITISQCCSEQGKGGGGGENLVLKDTLFFQRERNVEILLIISNGFVSHHQPKLGVIDCFREGPGAVL